MPANAKRETPSEAFKHITFECANYVADAYADWMATAITSGDTLCDEDLETKKIALHAEWLNQQPTVPF